MKKLLLLLMLPLLSFGQNPQIHIDGQFDDWENITMYNDPIGDVDAGIDFLNISITNDSKYLYIKFKTGEETDLLDGEFNEIELYDIELFIDTDNNSKTGFSPFFNANMGFELGIMFNQRYVWYNTPDPDIQISLYDIGIFPAPTVTSNEFEIALDLEAEYDGIPLFPNSEIKVQIRDWVSLDNMPDVGSEIIYTINSSFFNYPPININKESEYLIRLTAYNVLSDGFNNEDRRSFLKNTLQALNSDIFTFSECSNTSEETVKNILDEILPLEISEGWTVIKKENDDLILASKFPIIEHWPNESNGIKRMHPCLIDLPDNVYAKDLLVVNAHMSCCDNDIGRQEQADDFVNFILDAKYNGGEIDLIEETPFVLCGDLNLVGASQQLNTLLTGEIINTYTYGEGGGMNWSNANLKDQICWNTELPLSYTWRDISSNPGSYPPGRLDFIIFSNDVMIAQKSFSIDTEFMSQENLNKLDLNSNDSSGSDHLAITTDFSIPLLLLEDEEKNIFKKIWKKINLIGQKTKSQTGFYIEIYDDGSVRKKGLIQ